jgi:hypothetical protein
MALQRAALLALALFAGSVPAFAGGVVTVNVVKADEYSDIGRSIVDREQNLAMLAGHLKTLGKRLPDGQALTIEVLDVDLAGEVWPTRRFGEVRILRGGVDWPRMHLRWILQSNGRTLRTGDDRLADMAYLMHSSRLGMNQALAYDLRMVDKWFGQTFADDAPH